MTSINSVYSGSWTDYSGGQDRLITLSSRDTNFLIAFLAVFVMVAGNRLWAILSFIIHQVRSDGNARDGLYHQRQAVLRNANGSLYSLVYLAKITWAWRHRAAQPWRRQFPLLTLAVVHIAIFAASSILASEVASVYTSGQVLLSGQDPCQWWISPPDDPEQTTFWTTQRAVFRKSRNYAATCYISNSSSLDNTTTCGTFAVPSIPFTVQTNASCPFSDPTFCRNSSLGPIQIATGDINSNTILGLNAAVNDQVNFRQYMTCSPIPDTNNTDFVVDSTIQLSGSSGSSQILVRNFYYSADANNVTYQALWSPQDIAPPYFLNSLYVGSNSSTIRDFNPDPGLMPETADLTLHFVTNTVDYIGQSNDSIFSATDPVFPGNNVVLWSGRKFSAFACAHQYQFCNPVNGKCTIKGGWADLGKDSSDPLSFTLWNDDGLTQVQRATITNLKVGATFAAPHYVTSALGQDSLLASDQLILNSLHKSTALADDQFLREMKFWFSIRLAALQDEFVGLIFNKADPSNVQKLHNLGLDDLCHRQRIYNPDFASINVLGLSLILGVGSFIIFLSLTLPSLVGSLQRILETDPYMKEEWDSNELLQMQRTMFQGRGVGIWSNKMTVVPVTMPFEKFTQEPGRATSSRARLEPEITRSVGNARYMAVMGQTDQTPIAEASVDPHSPTHLRNESVEMPTMEQRSTVGEIPSTDGVQAAQETPPVETESGASHEARNVIDL